MLWKNPSAGLFIDAGGRVRVVGAPCLEPIEGDVPEVDWDAWTVEEKVGEMGWVAVQPFALLNDAMEWARLTYDVEKPAIAF